MQVWQRSDHKTVRYPVDNILSIISVWKTFSSLKKKGVGGVGERGMGNSKANCPI